MENRKLIKHNFLKQIIFRLDFTGLSESDIEKKILPELGSFFHENGLTNYNERTENQIDFQIQADLNGIDDSSFSAQNRNKKTVYCYSSDDQNNTIEISNSFFTWKKSIDGDYKGFDHYISLLIRTIEVLSKQALFFKPHRMGLRKINICLLDDLNVIAQYFVQGAFNTIDTINQVKQASCKASNLTTIFFNDPYKINYIRDLQEGTTVLDGGIKKTVFQVVLDIDVYNDSFDKNRSSLYEGEKVRTMISKMNTIAYEFFESSLTETFIDKLKMDKFTDSHISEVK